MIEEFLHLLKDPAHWMFELTSDVALGILMFPWIRSIKDHLNKHK